VTERPMSGFSRIASAVSTVAMVTLLYLGLFQRGGTPIAVWAALFVLWLCPAVAIAIVERRSANERVRLARSRFQKPWPRDVFGHYAIPARTTGRGLSVVFRSVDSQRPYRAPSPQSRGVTFFGYASVRAAVTRIRP